MFSPVERLVETGEWPRVVTQGSIQVSHGKLLTVDHVDWKDGGFLQLNLIFRDLESLREGQTLWPEPGLCPPGGTLPLTVPLACAPVAAAGSAPNGPHLSPSFHPSCFRCTLFGASLGES